MARDIQERTFNFGVQVIELVDRIPRTVAGEVLAKQLIRSGTSVGSNMQEADGAESKKDFIHKVAVAYKEARESRHWLATLQATIMKHDAQVSTLWKESDEIVRILFAILNSARQSPNRPGYGNEQ
jgi:four helix bundle protein